MDLLCNAYSNDSDEEQGGQPKFEKSFTPPSSKRSKLQNPTPFIRPYQALPTSNHSSPIIRTDAPLPGRYVSKRERAVFASLPVAPELEKLPTSQGFFCFCFLFLFLVGLIYFWLFSFKNSSLIYAEKFFVLVVSVLGTTSDLNIRGDILSLLRSKTNGRAQLAQISERMSVALCSHTKAVNALHWSTTHGNFSFLNYLYLLFTPLFIFIFSP